MFSISKIYSISQIFFGLISIEGLDNLKLLDNLLMARKIMLIKKSPSFWTKNVENLKNILFKILNSHLIAKLYNITDFYSNKYKIITIIFTILLIWRI